MFDEDLDVENMRADRLRQIIFDELYEYRNPDFGLTPKSLYHIKKDELVRLYRHLAEGVALTEGVSRPPPPPRQVNKDDASYLYKVEMLKLTGFESNSTTTIPATLYEAIANYLSGKKPAQKNPSS